MRYFSLLLCLMVAAGSMEACNPGDTAVKKLPRTIQQQVDSIQKAEGLQGLFVAVMKNGKKDYYGAGFAIPDSKTRFDSATLFEIGSISKTFTGYVLESVLRESGMSDSLSILPFLPDSVQKNKALQSITFYSLLNHSSGLPRLPDNMDLISNPTAPYDNYTAKNLFAYLKTCTPQPTGGSSYSNLGAGLAGVLAQRISGKSYEDLLQKYIFNPFKIPQHRDATIKSNLNKAQGYFSDTESPYWFADILAPAGGLKCSADELLSYLQHIITPINTLSAQIIEKLLTPTIRISENVSVCRVWHTLETKGKPRIYWHNGGTYGFSSFAGFIEKENKAVVVVINQFNKNRISYALGFTLLKQLMD